MTQVLRFNHLTEQATKEALSLAAEEAGGAEWVFDDDAALHKRLLTEKLKEIGLTVVDIEYHFKIRDATGDIEFDGKTLDYFDIEVTDDFFKSTLSESDFQAYSDLHGVSFKLIHCFFDTAYSDTDYQMVFDEKPEYDSDNPLMRFVVKYTADEDVRAKYTFPLLVESSLTEEESELLREETEEVEETVTEYINQVLDPVMLGLSEKIKYLVAK